MASPGSGRVLKRLIKSFSIHIDRIWARHLHPGPISSRFCYFLTFSNEHFLRKPVFLKKWISCGSSAQSAKPKMIAYWSSNSKVFTGFRQFWCIFTSNPCHFCQKTLFRFKPYNISSKENLYFRPLFFQEFCASGRGSCRGFFVPKKWHLEEISMFFCDFWWS